MTHDLVIIGSGPAGLTAAIYAARAGLSPLCIEGFSAGGLVPGGQLMFTTHVENYPGFPEAVLGQDLMAAFRKQAENQGTQFVTEDVLRVDFGVQPFKLWVGEDKPKEVEARAVIVATGARANYLGLPSEEALKNKGVSACAVCDGALFRDQEVAVVGGGDSAMEEALYLAGICSKVTLIHRRETFRASKVMQNRVFANDKITVRRSSVVNEVLDPALDRVTGVRLHDTKTQKESLLEVSALFLAIGHTPLTELFRGQLRLLDSGYIQVEPGSTKTNVPGVFAAGDVADFVYRQAVTAASSGCKAALDAERWLVGATGAKP